MSMKLSYLIADFFITKNWIKEEEKLAYIVGLDVIFSTGEQLLLVLLLGLWKGRFAEAIVYILFVLTVRKYSGGYHASTRFRCTAFFTGAYLLADAAAEYVCRADRGGICILYGIGSILAANIVFYLFAPIKNDRKKFHEERLLDARKKAFAYMNIWNVFAAGVIAFSPGIAGEIFSASNIVTLFILLCKPWKKRAASEWRKR